MTEKERESAQDILKRAELKCTPGRVALLNLLLAAEDPLSQHEMAQQLENITLNGVSIYRSLDAFLKAGIVHRVDSGDRVWRFAVCGCGSSMHCHPHFICKQCGRVECLNDYKLPDPGELEPGYVVEEQEVYIRGRCNSCTS